MTIEQLRHGFEIRYYLWARKEAQQELERNFFLVRRVKNPGATRFLRVIDRMSREDQCLLVIALVKRFHKNILKDVEEQFSLQEDSAVNGYLRTTFALPSKTAPINRKKLAKEVRVALTPIVGDVVRSTALTWWHEKTVDGCILQTSLDAGAKFEHVAYFHSLRTVDNLSVAPTISLLSWLGITGTTSWVLDTEDDIAGTVQVLVELCQKFTAEVPSLLGSAPAYP